MSFLHKLFKQTFIYGLATVLPRVLSVVLIPIYTGVLETGLYGNVVEVFSWIAICNVLLSYGMETAFFRFYHSSVEREKVVSTTLISILATTIIFVIGAFLFKSGTASLIDINPEYIGYAILIIALDALVIVPFAWLRANEKPMRYAIVKITNVAISLGLTVFFLKILPVIITNNPTSIFQSIYKDDFQISYIFIATLIASGVTFLLMLRVYLQKNYVFDIILWKKMIKYAMPLLVAGIAFTINEVFDKLILTELLPRDTADSEMGKYAACYKLGMFMTLFATAFRMGIEPFFFSHSTSKNPQKGYAQITNYFIIFGSVILLAVVVFSDVIKVVLIRKEEYWEAMNIVPVILLAGLFLGIYHNLSVWYKVTDRTHFGAYISVIGAILTIIINFVFIEHFGYMASAIATLVAYGSMMLLSFYFGRMYYPVPYNFRKICFYLSVSILFSILSFYVFDRNLIIGCILLALFLGILYKLENDKLKRIFLKK
ncbi:MAG: polysaccharide biosynthesis C-terminal domain-containing protein [Cellulophaga sp.]